MSGFFLLQVGVFFAALLALAWPLGHYMARVFLGDIPVWMCWMRVHVTSSKRAGWPMTKAKDKRCMT